MSARFGAFGCGSGTAGPDPRPRGGFTLVEMLVTLAIFSLALSSLVVGLQSGIRAWRTVQTHQSREAAETQALERMRRDFRRLAVVSQEEPALRETREGSALRVVEITALGSRRQQRAGEGAVWSKVSYALEKGEEDLLRLVRTEVPYVAGKPMMGVRSEETLVEGLIGWRLQYSGPDGRTESWESEKALPRSVEITLEPPGRRCIRASVWVPCGAWGGPPA